MCGKCSTMSGVVVLLVGVAFLISNLTTWNFWGIQWYSAAFILIGVGMLGSSCCGQCNTVVSDKKPMKKK